MLTFIVIHLLQGFLNTSAGEYNVLLNNFPCIEYYKNNL